MGTTRYYKTTDEAIQREIVDRIEESGIEDASAEYDINAIARMTIAQSDGMYFMGSSEEAFWATVKANETETGL